MRLKMADFTLTTYGQILAHLQRAGYHFGRFGEALSAPSVVLRHDVDRRPERALRLAALEGRAGARSTYFFRTHPCSFSPEIIRAVAGHGHEIGYHYEDLCDSHGDRDAAWTSFGTNLHRLRQLAPVRVISAHGRPLSPWDSRILWQDHDYRDHGIEADASHDVDWSRTYYLTDTGRGWGSTANLRDHPDAPEALRPPDGLRTSRDLLSFIDTVPPSVVISLHPERWCEGAMEWSTAWGRDMAASLVKFGLRQLRPRGRMLP